MEGLICLLMGDGAQENREQARVYECDGERGAVFEGETYSNLKSTCENTARVHVRVSPCVCVGLLLPLPVTLFPLSAVLPPPAAGSASASLACARGSARVNCCTWTFCPSPTRALDRVRACCGLSPWGTDSQPVPRLPCRVCSCPRGSGGLCGQQDHPVCWEGQGLPKDQRGSEVSPPDGRGRGAGLCGHGEARTSPCLPAEAGGSGPGGDQTWEGS